MKSISGNSLAGAMILASLVAFGSGWILAPQPSAKSAPGDGDGGKVWKVSRERRSRAHPAADKRMDRIRNSASPEERSRAAISLAMTLSPSEFAAWVEGDKFSARSGPELSIFRMILFERWIAEDPDGLIAWGIHNDYGQAGRALDHLAKHDPERVLAHFREHPNEAAELRQLNEIAKGHPSLALARLKELHEAGISSGSDRTSRELLLEISKGSIAELETALVSLPDGMKEQAESVIYGRKLEKDFPGEITKLMNHPEGMRIFLENVALLEEQSDAILAAIPDMPDYWRIGLAASSYKIFPAVDGIEWIAADLEALGFSAGQAVRIRKDAFKSLMHRDPVYVLNNFDASGLDKNYLDYTISNMVRRSGDDAEELERAMAKISSPEIKDVVREQWEQREGLLALQNESAKSTPSDWLRSLGALAASSSSMNGIASHLGTLDEKAITEYRRDFRDLSGEMKTGAAITIAKSMRNSTEPSGVHGDAILYLVQNAPAKEDRVSAFNQYEITKVASNYAVHLATNDTAAAVKWVGDLPEGASREWAAKNLAANWNQYEPEAVSAWMKTLGAGERKLVQGHLDGKP